MSVNDPVTLTGRGGREGETRLVVTLANDAITFGPSWYCEAGRRFFTLPAAKTLLDRLDMTREFDAWYAGVDSRGQGFAAKVVADRIYIDQEPRDPIHEDPAGDDAPPNAPNFSWSQFERAVKARTKRTKPQQS